MSNSSQFQAGQPEIDSLSAEIRQYTQNLFIAEQAGDGATVAFLRKRLEELGKEKLIILRAQDKGQCCLLLSIAWHQLATALLPA